MDMQRLLYVVAAWLAGFCLHTVVAEASMQCWARVASSIQLLDDILYISGYNVGGCYIILVGIRYAHHLPILLATTRERERVSPHGGG